MRRVTAAFSRSAPRAIRRGPGMPRARPGNSAARRRPVGARGAAGHAPVRGPLDAAAGNDGRAGRLPGRVGGVRRLAPGGGVLRAEWPSRPATCGTPRAVPDLTRPRCSSIARGRSHVQRLPTRRAHAWRRRPPGPRAGRGTRRRGHRPTPCRRRHAGVPCGAGVGVPEPRRTADPRQAAAGSAAGAPRPLRDRRRCCRTGRHRRRWHDHGAHFAEGHGAAGCAGDRQRLRAAGRQHRHQRHRRRNGLDVFGPHVAVERGARASPGRGPGASVPGGRGGDGARHRAHPDRTTPRRHVPLPGAARQRGGLRDAPYGRSLREPRVPAGQTTARA